MRRKAWTFNVSVDFWDHPKSTAAGRDGRDLFLCAIGWSGKERTNGVVPVNALGLLAGKVGISATAARKAAARLADVGLFEPHPDGWLIHDYCGPDGWQLSTEERDAQAARVRDRKTKSRATSRVTPPATDGGGNARNDAQRVSSHTDSRFGEEVQSSSQGGPGETTTTEQEHQARAACRLLAEHDLAARQREHPAGGPIAQPERWLTAAAETRWQRHSGQAIQLADQGLDPSAIAAALRGDPQPPAVARPDLEPIQPPTVEPDPALNVANVRQLRSVFRAQP